MLNKHTKTNSGDPIYREHRLVWKLNEGSDSEEERLENMYVQKFAERNTERGREGNRGQMIRLFQREPSGGAATANIGPRSPTHGQNNPERGSPSDRNAREDSNNVGQPENQGGQNAGEVHIPEEVKRDPRRAREFYEEVGRQVRSHHGEAIVDRGPVRINMARSAAAVGTTAFIPSYLAYLARNGITAPAFAGVAAGGGLGWYLGKHLAPNHPKIGKSVGAAIGVASPTALEWGLSTIGTKMATATPALATGITSSVLGLAFGGYVYHKLRQEWQRGPQWLKRQWGVPSSLAVSGFAAGAGTLGASMITNIPFLSTAASSGVQALGALSQATGAALLNVAPSSAAVIPSIAGAAPLGIWSAIAGAGLYGLGRAHGWMWNRPKAGIWKTMLAGGTIGIPSILLGGLDKLGWKPAKRIARAVAAQSVKEYEAAKNMILNFNIPFAAPVAKAAGRTIASPFAGLWYGLTKKDEPSESQQKLGGVGKVIRAVPYAAGRIARSPKDLWDWALEPTPPGWPLTKGT
ncbi:MAG: hypothetical protein ABIA92_02015 [Patescibacteria group bacterium]